MSELEQTITNAIDKHIQEMKKENENFKKRNSLVVRVLGATLIMSIASLIWTIASHGAAINYLNDKVVTKLEFEKLRTEIALNTQTLSNMKENLDTKFVTNSKFYEIINSIEMLSKSER